MQATLSESILRNIVELSKKEGFGDLSRKFRKAQPAVFDYVQRALPFASQSQDELWALSISAWQTATERCADLRKISNMIIRVQESRNIRYAHWISRDKEALQRLFIDYELWPVLNFFMLVIQSIQNQEIKGATFVAFKTILDVFQIALILSPAFRQNQFHQYIVRVRLRQIKPEIWRRFTVPGNITLKKLHDILQIVMGWQDYHLHAFQIGGTSFGVFDLDEEMDFLDEKSFRLEEISHGREIRFEYQYDFGDGWIHEIHVAPTNAEQFSGMIRCLEGERACPPEDCGGPYGYAELLEKLSNPADPEFEQMWTWAGHDFDSEKFDYNQINRKLKRKFKKQQDTPKA